MRPAAEFVWGTRVLSSEGWLSSTERPLPTELTPLATETSAEDLTYVSTVWLVMGPEPRLQHRWAAERLSEGRALEEA